jgi:hypothetical protein
MKLTPWGKNIGDEEYINNYIDFGPGFGGITPLGISENRLLMV